MKPRLTLYGAAALALVSLVAVTSLSAQAPPEGRPLMAEEVFKSVQVLRGIPVNQFMETMGFFSASLSLNCTSCHGDDSGGDWAAYADDRPVRKQITRRMVQMVNALNQASFQGRQVVTCYTCHRGSTRPQVIPSLAVQYGEPLAEEPDEILVQAPRVPPADQILDKYLQALGGVQRLAGITSLVAIGTRRDFDDLVEKYPLELYARATGQHATVVHSRNGDRSTIFDGRNGWSAAPQDEVPVTVLPLTGGDLDGARIDAELFFPARIKQAFTEWRVTFPTTIDDRQVHLVQGTGPSRNPVKFYFDMESELLTRVVRYTQLPVGRTPTQIDYSDYRDVAGVKVPFRIVVTWTDGRSLTELTEVRFNVPIDLAKFGKPPVPMPAAQPDAVAR